MRLSTYVLAARLEQVAAAASERLSRMSGGRFTIVHTDEAPDGRRKGGLGLRVVDAWTSTHRETASLSGGESFFTSLALALGVADIVSAEAGGITIDTMFIDEGFGSLDEDTLQQVLDVIDSLRAGGRTIGIVSHVADLRDRITTQLEVIKGPDGSSLRTTAPTRPRSATPASTGTRLQPPRSTDAEPAPPGPTPPDPAPESVARRSREIVRVPMGPTVHSGDRAHDYRRRHAAILEQLGHGQGVVAGAPERQGADGHPGHELLRHGGRGPAHRRRPSSSRWPTTPPSPPARASTARPRSPTSSGSSATCSSRSWSPSSPPRWWPGPASACSAATRPSARPSPSPARRLGAIFLWSLLTGTVGLVLNTIQQRAGLLGGIVVRAIGMAWQIVTWLAVPVIVVEGTGPVTSLKRSAHLFRQTWGENLIGQVGFGLVGFVFMAPGPAHRRPADRTLPLRRHRRRHHLDRRRLGRAQHPQRHLPHRALPLRRRRAGPGRVLPRRPRRRLPDPQEQAALTCRPRAARWPTRSATHAPLGCGHDRRTLSPTPSTATSP